MNRAPPWVKICGLRGSDDIEAAVLAAADAVGFVFHEGSPRNVSLADAALLGRLVPSGIEKVAVFLHPTQAVLDAAIAALEPDYVQLDFADLESLRLPAGQKVLPVLRSNSSYAELEAAARRHGRFLLESGRSGAGERADWSVAARLAAGDRMILAGGLNPCNVGEAVRTVRPFGVDVSSGVEAAPGIKDPELIMEFVVAARAAGLRLRDEDAARRGIER